MKVKDSVKVHAIIVTFNPEHDVLLSEIALLSPQVDKIWLIDNASTQCLSAWANHSAWEVPLELVQMTANLGLGAAQNVGIDIASATGATHVLILDQDSHPMPGMVSCLLAASNRLQSAGVRVAAIAPEYFDATTGAASGFVRLGWLGYKKQKELPKQEVVEADFLISSGSLIPVSVFNDVGTMDESLFIDHIDTEWCMRAKSKGFRLFGLPAARMLHSLGDRRARIWFLRWRNVSHHSPFRYYYMVRNGILLQHRSYIPFKWKLPELYRIVRGLLFYGLFGKDSTLRLIAMLRGGADGFRGVTGSQPRSGF